MDIHFIKLKLKFLLNVSSMLIFFQVESWPLCWMLQCAGGICSNQRDKQLQPQVTKILHHKFLFSYNISSAYPSKLPFQAIWCNYVVVYSFKAYQVAKVLRWTCVRLGIWDFAVQGSLYQCSLYYAQIRRTIRQPRK